MGKLIKYELRGTYKIFLGLLVIVSIIDTILLTRLDVWGEGSVTGLMITVNMALCILTLLIIINSFKKELYEDRGYLTFTLPVSGNTIVASKLISAIIWFIVVSIFCFVSFRILIGNKNATQIVNLVRALDLKAVIILGSVSVVINTITLVLVIYFAISLTRVAYKGKKVSGMVAFVVFIALYAVIFYISFKITDMFPQSFHVTLNLENCLGRKGSINTGAINLTDANLTINIASTIYQIVVYIGLFLGTGYLIEKKINI